MIVGPLLITGIPKGQPRVRAFVRGGHAGVYDPGTADDWKAVVLNTVRHAHPSPANTDKPVCVRMVFHLPRPKSHHNSKGVQKPTAPKYHTGKPDADNLAKAVLDVLTTLGVWRDDSQVAKLEVEKHYAEAGWSGLSMAVTELQT